MVDWWGKEFSRKQLLFFSSGIGCVPIMDELQSLSSEQMSNNGIKSVEQLKI